MIPLPAVIHCTSPAPSAAVVAEAVAVLHRAGQHIGDGLDAAMRVPRKAGAIVVGPVVAEIVEQQERVEIAGVAEPESAVQLHAGAFHGGRGRNDALDWSNGHGGPRSNDVRLGLETSASDLAVYLDTSGCFVQASPRMGALRHR